MAVSYTLGEHCHSFHHHSESIYHGWELMSSVTIAFPPSKNFEAYLQSFMRECIDAADEKASTFAQHCLGKLDRICKKGPRGKVLTVAEIDRAKVCRLHVDALV